MEYSTSATSSKVAVEYTDPSKIYQNISQGLSRRLPLRNLHWNSSSRPLRSIKSLHVELIPDDKRSSGSVPLDQSHTQSQDTSLGQSFPKRSKAEERPPLPSADSSTKRERRHQIPGLRQTPYLKIYLLRCDDVDGYKSSSRKLIREWVKDHTPAFQRSSKYNTQENHDAFEWLILHVISADSQGTDRGAEDGKGDSRWSKRSSSNLIEKIRTDFNGTSKTAVDRVAQIYISGETVGQSSDDGDTGWGDLIFKMKSLILASFDLRVRQYEEDIKERESQRSLPGWNFNTFFVLKEGLAMGFESVGLIEDALTSYHELAVGLHSILEERFADGPSTTSASQFQDYTNDLLVEVKQAAAIALGASFLSNGDRKHGEATTSEDLGHDILSTDRKPFRELILANKISAFDFQCYIFARQAALLLRMGNASTPTIEDARDRPSPQPMHNSSPALGPTPEVENLLILADVCQRAVEFITSACRTMRNELKAILKTNTDGKTEGSLISFPSQDVVVENLTASWIYSTAEYVLSRTSTQSLSAQLQPLMRQLKPQQKAQASTKASTSPDLPRRTSSLSPNTTALQRPPSPEKFPSVTSLDAMRLLPPNLMQTGAKNLAAERAALHALKRRALSQIGLSYGGWRSGWPDMHLGEALEEHPMEEVSLDEAPDQKESPNGTATEKSLPFSMNGVRHKLLREALSSEKSFYSAYEDITALTLALDVLGKRKKSAEALTADLAAVRFHVKDYAAAASYFRQLAPFYAQGQWSELELVMLDLYAQCLGHLDRKEEYVSVALKIVAKQVEAKRRSRDSWKADLPKPSSAVSETSGSYLHSLIAASKSLERQITAPIDRYFGLFSLDPQIRHNDKHDSFHLLLKLQLQALETFLAEEIRVCLMRMIGEQRSELWLTAANVTIAAEEITKVSVASRVMAPGIYVLEKVLIRSEKIIFQHDLSIQAPQILPSTLDNADLSGPPITSIDIFPGPQALSAQILHSKTIHLEQPRSLEIHISVGWNDISHGRILVRAGTAGLRLHTGDAVPLGGDISVTNKSQPGVIEFGKVVAFRRPQVRIPYSVESDLKEIIVKLEVSYTTTDGEYTFASLTRTSILLPLGVNVQDIFKQEALFSKFSIFTASSVPIRLLNCHLGGTSAFQVDSPPLSGTELDIFARQPVTLMAKIRRAQNQQTDNTKAGRRLLLHVQYICLDEEVATAVEQAFTTSLETSDFYSLTNLLTPHLLRTLRSQLSVANYETIGLLRELTLPPFSSLNYPSLLNSLPPQTRSSALTWLSTWHTGHPILPLPPSSSISTPQPHHLTVPVEIPALQILHTVRLRLLPPSSSTPQPLTINQPLPAELTISHTRRWAPVHPSPDKALDFVYEVHAPADTWLVGGQRKAHFEAKEDELRVFMLLLLPQRTGRLLLPGVEVGVEVRGEEGKGRSCETDYRCQAGVVEVGTGLERVSVQVEGAEAWVVEGRGRGEV